MDVYEKNAESEGLLSIYPELISIFQKAYISYIIINVCNYVHDIEHTLHI